MNYSKYLNDTVQSLQPSGIRKFFDIVAEQKNAISLGVGEPDFDTPWLGRSAAIKSIQKGLTQYTSNCGMPDLRDAVAKYYAARYRLKYNPKTEIIVTVGASEAIDLALRSVIKRGEKVVVPDPSYVSYCPCILLSGGVPVPINCTAENGFAITPENLEQAITPGTKAIILPYPNNPTGGIMTESQLRAISDIIVRHDLIVISDEIYSELTYSDAGHFSIAEIEGLRERCIVINGFSKSFAMTGWRLGYVLAPPEITHAMYKIHQYTIMCAPTCAQYAALAIMNEELSNGFSTVLEMRNEYDMRRRYILSTLRRFGFNVFEPMGAFYIFPSVTKFGMDGETFANRLLEAEHVAVVPGSAFGESGKNHIRISYAYSMADLSKALERIKRFIDNL
jgi:aminotransferase